MESIGEDGNVASLSEGDACGEELLTWCLEHSSISRGDYTSCKDCLVGAFIFGIYAWYNVGSKFVVMTN